MKFPKQFLIELACEDYDDDVVQIVHTSRGSPRRWVTPINLVFQYQGKLYRTTYETGNTESQDTSPYEYEPDEIECAEVVPKETTVVVYVNASESAA
jgi:hypothetical protein